MPKQPLDFTGYSSIQFLIYLSFPATVSEATHGTLKKYKILPRNFFFKIVHSKITFSKSFSPKKINVTSLIYSSSELSESAEELYK